MPEAPTTTAAVADFLRRWEASGAAERPNYQLFLSELCDLLSVVRPEPTRPDDRDNAYVFERRVTFRYGDGTTSIGRIDLYRRGHFVCEAKQGSDQQEKSPLAVREEGVRWSNAKRGTAVRGTKGWDLAMVKAKGQAEQYARALPVGEGWLPLLVVVDVGHAIELYSEFSCTGKTYLPFPDPRSHRILLADLGDEAVRERLRLVRSDPHSLDPSKHSAKATREVADRLALLAKSLEQAGHGAEKVGNFLKRCLFTMFAEDVGLIPHESFTTLLESLCGKPETFAPMAESLWATMKDGGFSPVLREKLLRFNGGLFEEAEALPVGEEQLVLLLEASKADWRDVEPAIFGTLLERALDPPGAPPPGGALHAAGVRRETGAPHRGRAAACRVGGRPGRRRHGDSTGGQGRSHRPGQGVPPQAVPRPRAGPGLRQRQLPLRHFRTPETFGGGGAERPGRFRRAADCAGAGRHDRGPAPTAGAGGQPPRRRHHRHGAVDRLPPVALPHPRRGSAAGAGYQEVPQRRVPGRSAGLRRHRAGPGRER